ncbi:MAG: AMP-binding protein [Deltaproteobacteria bacterium]|nr:AMP-binding protein [Deltaproteobacteria bacterium]
MLSLGDMLAQEAAQRPRDLALVHHQRGVRFTYADFWDNVQKAARGLAGLGIGSGDRVVLWADNQPAWLKAQYALASLGAVWVPADPAAGADDLVYLLNHSEAKALILGEGFSRHLDDWSGHAALAEALAKLTCLVSLGRGGGRPPAIAWSEVLAGRGPELPPPGSVSPDEVTAVIYTSGTTGAPKGVMVSHAGLMAKTKAAAERLGLTPADRLALFCPLFHMFGNTCIALAGFLSGAALVIPSDNFQPGPVLDALEAERCSAIFGTPSMFLALLDHPDYPRRALGRLRTGIIGGAQAPLELMKRLTGEMGARDLAIGYGQTEACSWISLTGPEDPLELRVSSVGRPLPGAEVKVVDPAGWESLPPGRVGEICARGSLMVGYYAMPEVTARTIDREGWLHTGDLGVLDEKGYLSIKGRLKEVIAREGGSVFPAQVEEVLYSLEGVSEAQVFGAARPDGQELVLAWLRPRPGANLDLAQVAAHCRGHLPPDQQPDRFKLVESFPTTRSGKVQKFRLRELAEAELAAEAG